MIRSKKLLYILLAVFIIASLLPLSVFAAVEPIAAGYYRLNSSISNLVSSEFNYAINFIYNDKSYTSIRCEHNNTSYDNRNWYLYFGDDVMAGDYYDGGDNFFDSLYGDRIIYVPQQDITISAALWFYSYFEHIDFIDEFEGTSWRFQGFSAPPAFCVVKGSFEVNSVDYDGTFFIGYESILNDSNYTYSYISRFNYVFFANGVPSGGGGGSDVDFLDGISFVDSDYSIAPAALLGTVQFPSYDTFDVVFQTEPSAYNYSDIDSNLNDFIYWVNSYGTLIVDDPEPEFNSSVNVYNNDGSELLATFQFNSDTSVSLSVSNNGLVYGDRVIYTYSGSENFLGFSGIPDSDVSAYLPGDIIGYGGNFDLYLVTGVDEPDPDPPLYDPSDEPFLFVFSEIFNIIPDFFTNISMAFWDGRALTFFGKALITILSILIVACVIRLISLFLRG